MNETLQNGGIFDANLVAKISHLNYLYYKGAFADNDAYKNKRDEVLPSDLEETYSDEIMRRGIRNVVEYTSGGKIEPHHLSKLKEYFDRVYYGNHFYDSSTKRIYRTSNQDVLTIIQWTAGKLAEARVNNSRLKRQRKTS